jgi:hypothetical protein
VACPASSEGATTSSSSSTSDRGIDVFDTIRADPEITLDSQKFLVEDESRAL